MTDENHNEVNAMTTEQVNIRDPFILPHGGVYYLYGTRSPDTEFEEHPIFAKLLSADGRLTLK